MPSIPTTQCSIPINAVIQWQPEDQFFSLHRRLVGRSRTKSRQGGLLLVSTPKLQYLSVADDVHERDKTFETPIIVCALLLLSMVDQLRSIWVDF